MTIHKKNTFTYDDDPSLANALGSVIINFALFNSQLNAALSAVYEVTIEQARAFVIPLHPRTKLEQISAYTKHYYTEENYAPIKEICDLGLTVTAYRNKIAHGDMIASDINGPVSLVTYQGKARFNPKITPIPAKDVAHNAVVILRLAYEFRRLALCIVEGTVFEATDNPD